ncbi:MAG: DUF4112 domain-containing protein [Hyphomicrobiales bacterium]|nr:MAG: DUF4112 domain-containing protein [Hyphomicrobiales bacterium]
MTMAYSLPPQRSRAETIERLDALARILDSAVRIPGTNVRVGADALLNLIPGAGLAVAKGLSTYLVLEAKRHGAPTPMLWRMARRVGIDLALSAIPVVGWFGDAFYRANLKNIQELRNHLLEVGGPGPTSLLRQGR